jgi:ubiquitin-conjugating enzyme E2 J2
VVPNSENIFEWHFVLHNFENSPYEGGQYHGKLLIPAEYPMKPPTLIFVTPQGRFKPGEKICLYHNLCKRNRSFTSYHPESWSTSWTIESMLIGLMSFMHNNEPTAGSVTTTDAEKRRLAKQSVRYNLENPQFEKVFRSRYEVLGLNKDGQIINCE